MNSQPRHHQHPEQLKPKRNKPLSHKDWLDEEISYHLQAAADWQRRRSQEDPSFYTPGWSYFFDESADHTSINVELGRDHDRPKFLEVTHIDIESEYPYRLSDGLHYIDASLANEGKQDLTHRLGGRQILLHNTIVLRKFTCIVKWDRLSRNRLFCQIRRIDFVSVPNQRFLPLRNSAAPRTVRPNPLHSADRCHRGLTDLTKSRAERIQWAEAQPIQWAEAERTQSEPDHPKTSNGYLAESIDSKNEMRPVTMDSDTEDKCCTGTQCDGHTDGKGVRREVPVPETRARKEQSAQTLLALLNRKLVPLPASAVRPNHGIQAPQGHQPAALRSISRPIEESPITSENSATPISQEPLMAARNADNSDSTSGIGLATLIPREPPTPARNGYARHGINDRDPDADRSSSEQPILSERSGSSPTKPRPSETPWMAGWCFNASSTEVMKDQVKLLSHPQSWQKPEPGYRFPAGNMPIAIFSDIAAQIAAQRESTPMEDSSSEEASESEGSQSNVVQEKDDEDMPDAVIGVDSDADVATSLISGWSPTPERSPPLSRSGMHLENDSNLPPDSSFDAAKQGAHVCGTGQPDPSLLVEPHLECSSAVTPPVSSPPVLNDVDDDGDEDMELALPQGLGEDIESHRHAKPVHIPPVIQVNETPYGRPRNEIPVPRPTSSAQNQTSSGETKNTSSTSIVFGTYREVPESPPHDDIHMPMHENGQWQQDSKRSALTRADEDLTVTEAPPSNSKSKGVSSYVTHVGVFPGESRINAPPESPHVGVATNKRKLVVSPSKNSPQQPKRRQKQIKVHLFDSKSRVTPFNDQPSSFVEERKAEIEKIRNARITATNTSSPFKVASSAARPQSSTDFGPPSRINGSTSSLVPSRTNGTSERVIPGTAHQNVRASVYDTFRTAYPKYAGDYNHFAEQCRDIYKLERKGRTVPPSSSWDDYVIRHRTEYYTFRRHWLETGKDPTRTQSYPEYFKDNVRDIQYTKGVLRNVATLVKVLGEFAERNRSITSPSKTAKRDQEPDPSLGQYTRQPRDIPRRSLPWNGSQKGTPAHVDGPSTTQGSTLTKSTPLQVRRTEASPTNPVALGPGRNGTTTTFTSPASRDRQSAIRIAPSTRTLITGHHSSAGPHQGAKDTTNLNGNAFRDFSNRFHKLTCFTGSPVARERGDAKAPNNVMMRQHDFGVSSKTNVLSWGDYL